MLNADQNLNVQQSREEVNELCLQNFDPIVAELMNLQQINGSKSVTVGLYGGVSTKNEHDLVNNEEHVSSKEGEDDFGIKEHMTMSVVNAAGMEFSSSPILVVSSQDRETCVDDLCNVATDGLEDSLDMNEELHWSEKDIFVNASNQSVFGD